MVGDADSSWGKPRNDDINLRQRGCVAHTQCLCLVMLQHNVHYSVWFLEGFAISEAFKISLVVRCIICSPSDPRNKPSAWRLSAIGNSTSLQMTDVLQLDCWTPQSQQERCGGGTLPMHTTFCPLIRSLGPFWNSTKTKINSEFDFEVGRSIYPLGSLTKWTL